MTLICGYVICGEARSGSTFLAHALESTGVLGRPGELFRDPAIVRSISGDGRRLLEYVGQVSTPNGVYGLKVFTSHFDNARELGWADRLPKLHFVYLERKDLLGQAISFARALQSGQYLASEVEREKPRYDRRLIADSLARLAYGRARWECYFARNGIKPLRLTYEDVALDVQRAAKAIAGHVGLTVSPFVDPNRDVLPVQRTSESETWRSRFICETANRTYLDAGVLFSGRRGAGRLARLFLGP